MHGSAVIVGLLLDFCKKHGEDLVVLSQPFLILFVRDLILAVQHVEVSLTSFPAVMESRLLPAHAPLGRMLVAVSVRC